VGNIAQASNDQASEIAQITKGIEQVSDVVQTNAATSEESAASSEQLSSQAEMLKQMISTFKLKTHTRQAESVNNPAAIKLAEMATRAGVVSMNWETQVATISGEVVQMGYQDVAVMNMDGHAQYINGNGQFDAWGEPWYEDGFKGKAAVSEETISKVTNTAVVFDVAPIKANGQVVGLLVGRRAPTN
jgi:methyl-accepting chemotaxis protein